MVAVVVAVVVLSAGGGGAVVTHGQGESPNLRVKRSHLTNGVDSTLSLRKRWPCESLGCAYVVLESSHLRSYALSLLETSQFTSQHAPMLARDCPSFRCRRKATLEYKFIRSLR